MSSRLLPLHSSTVFNPIVIHVHLNEENSALFHLVSVNKLKKRLGLSEEVR